MNWKNRRVCTNPFCDLSLYFEKVTEHYSETGCSFDMNLANLRRNFGNLIDSLSGASCNPREQVATCASNLLGLIVPRGTDSNNSLKQLRENQVLLGTLSLFDF